jgi:pimeloyl-ACP methyl ester carboxylesterase
MDPSDSATGSRGPDAPKPTLVLVHGAWADGSSWSAVMRRLQREGFTVVAAPNALRGIASDAAYLRAFLGTIGGPIVLAAHSYGGAVITNAANDNPNVEALVYVDAFIPDEGETIGALLARNPGSALVPALTDPTSVFTLRPFPGAPPGDVDTYLLPEVVRDAFANDLPPGDVAVIAAVQLPAAVTTVAELSGPAAWKRIPCWAVIGTEDRIIPPATQEFMAKRANARTVEVQASHVSLMSKPDAVAEVIRQAASVTA